MTTSQFNSASQSRPRIVVLDGGTLNPGDNPWDGLLPLGEVAIHDRTPPGEVHSRAAGAVVLVINKVRLPDDILAELPDLKLIAVTATGFDCVDIQAARQRGIAVANVPIYGTDSVAQFAFALILHLCHQVELHAKLVRDGEWANVGDFSFWRTPLVELAGKTLGVIGFGRIGRRVGELGHAFGMEIVAADEYRGSPPSYQPFSWAENPDLCRRSDFLTLHCNLTAANAKLVNREFLANVRPTAVLINTSRGGLVDEPALAAALNEGRLAAAAVDVLSQEPLRPDNPLLSAKNCTITPHIAWATLEARRRLMVTTVENIASFLDSRPTNVVN